jgi:hypothetical protein
MRVGKRSALGQAKAHVAQVHGAWKCEAPYAFRISSTAEHVLSMLKRQFFHLAFTTWLCKLAYCSSLDGYVTPFAAGAPQHHRVSAAMAEPLTRHSSPVAPTVVADATSCSISRRESSYFIAC